MNLVDRTSGRGHSTRRVLAVTATAALLAGCGATATPRAAQPAATAASTTTSSATSPPPKPGIYSDSNQAPFSKTGFAVANRNLGPYGHGWVYLWAGGTGPLSSSSSNATGSRPSLRVCTGPGDHLSEREGTRLRRPVLLAHLRLGRARIGAGVDRDADDLRWSRYQRRFRPQPCRAGAATFDLAHHTLSAEAPESGLAADATLVGTLEAVGGSAPGTPRPLAGTVTIRGSGRSVTVPVGVSGRYRIAVRPGRYRVTGRSPNYQDGQATCLAAAAVTIGRGRTVEADAICEEK